MDRILEPLLDSIDDAADASAAFAMVLPGTPATMCPTTAPIRRNTSILTKASEKGLPSGKIVLRKRGA